MIWNPTSRWHDNIYTTMRRLKVILLILTLVVAGFPRPTQIGLVCRMTGQAMQPVIAVENPTSCCAVDKDATGYARLANRSCCDLKITPGHPPLPGATLAHPGPLVAVLPSVLVLLLPPPTVALAAPQTVLAAAPYRGPPLRQAPSRAPPALS